MAGWITYAPEERASHNLGLRVRLRTLERSVHVVAWCVVARHVRGSASWRVRAPGGWAGRRGRLAYESALPPA